MYTINVDGINYTFHGPWAAMVEDLDKDGAAVPFIRRTMNQIQVDKEEEPTVMFKCSGAPTCGRPKCQHFVPHEPTDCVEQWVGCQSAAEECVKCKEVLTMEGLADMILAWWVDAQDISWPIGDGDWWYVFDEEPDFVRAAKKIKEEVTR